jgi:DNA polymerase-3 subunit gamma/tau
MFENLLFQDAIILIRHDLARKALPNALLFAGGSGTGKLTAALELARVLSCSQNAAWNCGCPSCLRHKALVSPDVLLAGPRDCILEIAAARKAFLEQVGAAGTRYLFIRSVRKLTGRFSPVLWADDDKVSKFAPLITQINEKLEELEPSRPLGDMKTLESLTTDILETARKLESGFLYDSIPVQHIRSASSWARHTQSEGKKLLVIENADRMQDSVRNALLKILEEPPAGTLFVLTTTKRSAIMPTILSRVRTYHFSNRSVAQQREILERVFHVPGQTMPGQTGAPETVDAYLRSFLPVDPASVNALGARFLRDSLNGNIPDIKKIEAEAGKFEPRLLLAAFFEGIFAHLRAMRQEAQNDMTAFARVTELEYQAVSKIRECYSRITTYNQTATAALEILAPELRHLGQDV